MGLLRTKETNKCHQTDLSDLGQTLLLDRTRLDLFGPLLIFTHFNEGRSRSFH